MLWNKEKMFSLCHGNINNPSSQGTNEMIKEGAKVVTNIEDILEEYPHIIR